MVKFARRDFTCWSDIHQAVNERCIDVCKALGEMITSSGTGWEYDSRTPVDTYLFIPSVNNTYQFPVSYFVNTISGAKMMVQVCVFKTNDGTADAAFRVNASNKNYFFASNCLNYLEDTIYNLSQVGVNIAIIPAGSSSVFPNVFPNDRITRFIPYDAIPLITESYYVNATIYNAYGTLGRLSTNNILSYGILIDSEFIMLFSSYSTTSARATLLPRFALGKIIGTLGHEADNTVSSHYGAVRFYNTYGSVIRDYESLNGTSPIYFNGYPFAKSATSSSLTTVPTATFFDSDGDLIACNGSFYPVGYNLLSSAISNDSVSDTVRWAPIGLAVMGNPGTKGLYVVEGDGFKGYLDTSLFRAAVCTPGNYYNNGAFVGLENNLLVAWDKDATDNIM